MSAAVETFALTKRFPAPRSWRPPFASDTSGTLAVDGVDLRVQKGELFGLVGPNGAGKTTLIKLLCTLILPTSGTARVNGHDLREESAVKRSIGLATGDERSFYWRLTGRQNLEFFATLQGLPAHQIQTRIDEVLVRVDLQGAADVRFQYYSSGMRQRLSIARALLSRPQILFLDEPTKGLDPTATREVHTLLHEQLADREGVTVFLTTHRFAEAEALCDRIAIMDRGRLRACGTLAELRTALGLAERYRLEVRGFRPSLQAALASRVTGLQLSHLNGTEAVFEFEVLDEDDLDDVIDLVRGAGGRVRSLSRIPISLEEVFAGITNRTVEDEALPRAGRPTASPGDPAAAALPTVSPEAPDTAGTGLPTVPPGAEPGETPSQASSPQHEREAAGHVPWNMRLRTGVKVALAFLRRDLRVETSYRLAFLLQFLGVFFSVAVFYFVARLLGEAASRYLEPYGGDYFSFVLIGIAFSGYLGVGLSSFSNSLRQAQTTGTLEAMLVTPISLSAIVLASSLWSYLMTTVRVLVYLAVGTLLLGVDLRGGNYPVALLILVLTVISFSSLGVLAASFVMIAKRGDPVTWVFNALSSLLGGVYYPIAILPDWLRPVSWLLPVTYALHSMRLALLQGASLRTLLLDVLALLLFSLLLLPLALFAFRYAVRRARIDGSLTHY